MANVLFLVGSLRNGSFNHQMAKQAETFLAEKAQVTYIDLAKIPLFNRNRPITKYIEKSSKVMLTLELFSIYKLF